MKRYITFIIALALGIPTIALATYYTGDPTITGSYAANATTTITSTLSATKGAIQFGSSYYNENTGNAYFAGFVGIGTQSPAVALQVTGGDARFNGATASQGIHGFSASTFVWGITRQDSPVSASTDLSVRNDLGIATGVTTDSTNYNVVIKASGKVGIASTTPDTRVGVTVATSSIASGFGGRYVASSTCTGTCTANWTGENGTGGNIIKYLLNQNLSLDVTSTSSNPIAGPVGLEFCQDAVGSRTVTFTNPVSLRWTQGTSTLTGTPNMCQIVYGMWHSNMGIYTFFGITPEFPQS
jgi:hypothetical protein